MNYNDYPYNIFNQSSLMNYGQQNNNDYQQYHAEQQKNIIEMRKAIRDYCESARKVAPEYQKFAIDQCLQEIVIQASKGLYDEYGYYNGELFRLETIDENLIN